MQHANNMAQIDEAHRAEMAKIKAGYYLKGDKWQNNLQLNPTLNQNNESYMAQQSPVINQNNQVYGALQSGSYTYQNYSQPYQYQNYPRSNSQQNLATYLNNQAYPQSNPTAYQYNGSVYVAPLNPTLNQSNQVYSQPNSAPQNIQHLNNLREIIRQQEMIMDRLNENRKLLDENTKNQKKELDENNKALMDLMAGIGLGYSYLQDEKKQVNLQPAPVFLN